MRKHLQFEHRVFLGFCLLVSSLSRLFSGLQTEQKIFAPGFIRYYTMCWFYSSCHCNSEVAQLNFVARCCALHISTYTKGFLIEFSFLSRIFIHWGCRTLSGHSHVAWFKKKKKKYFSWCFIVVFHAWPADVEFWDVHSSHGSQFIM